MGIFNGKRTETDGMDEPNAKPPRIRPAEATEPAVVPSVARVTKPKATSGTVTTPKKRLATLARTVKAQQGKAVQALLACGEALSSAQDLLADHNGGSFGKWVKESCGMSSATAYRMIGIYHRFGHVTETKQLADADALRRLAKADDAVVAKAIRVMETGKKLDLGVAKKLTATTKTKTDNRPEPIIIQTDGGSVRIVPRPGISLRRILLDALTEIQDDIADAA